MSPYSRFCLFLGSIAVLNLAGIAGEAGVVFMRTAGQHLYHEKVPKNAAHTYYTTIEGPSWETNYCCWRTYLDQDNRNCIDITGKKKYEPTLAHYDEPNADVHAMHDWGTDVLKVGSTQGLGAFRIQYGDEEWKNPELAKMDSLVVDLIDTIYDSPRVRLAYWGWQITESAKIDVFWTIETKKEMRSTMCELTIDGPLNNTKVIVGMTKSSGVQHIEDTENHNLITIGVQTEVNDSLMMAIHADEKYFDAFTSNSANYALILNLDENQTAKWAFTNSWVQEPEPVFRKSGWQDELFSDLPPTTGVAFKNRKHLFTVDDNSSRFRNSSGELTIVNLAGKTVSGRYAPRNDRSGIPQMPKGCYIVRDMKNGHQMLNLPVINMSE